MSDGIVAAVVCEGHTDFPIIRAIIEELWPEVEEVLCLQPELDETERADRKKRSGWTEVRRWCEQHADDLHEVISPPIGPRISLLVIAVDLDIAIEANIVNPPAHLGAYESSRLQNKMREWCATTPAKRRRLPREVLFSTPVMAIETWIIAALFPKRTRPEQIDDPAQALVDKRKLRKSPRNGRPWKELHRYQAFAANVARKLGRVRKSCSEADRTCREVEGLRDSLRA